MGLNFDGSQGNNYGTLNLEGAYQKIPKETSGGESMALPILPLIGGGLSLLSGIFGSASQRKQQKQQLEYQKQKDKADEWYMTHKQVYNPNKDMSYQLGLSGLGSGTGIPDMRYMMPKIDASSPLANIYAMQYAGIRPYMGQPTVNGQVTPNQGMLDALYKSIAEKAAAPMPTGYKV